VKISEETRDAIVGAANDLLADGVANPTNEQVRSRLGKGSLSHISPVMKEWREARKAEAKAALEMPRGLSQAVHESIGRLWGVATGLAQASFEAHRKEADEAVRYAEQERDEALSEVGRLELVVEELEKELSAGRVKLEVLEGKLEREVSRNAELAAENSSLSSDLTARREQLDALRLDMDVVRQDYRSLQAELVEMAKSGRDRSVD